MHQRKIPEVNSAKALMTEAMTWSVMRWLREKKRVRATADQANAALDALSEQVRAEWPPALRDQYHALCPDAKGRPRTKENSPKQVPASALRSDAMALKHADESAYRARIDAETTFDEAEKKLSTALAREGCKKAIDAWELQEQAIHRSRGFIVSK